MQFDNTITSEQDSSVSKGTLEVDSDDVDFDDYEESRPSLLPKVYCDDVDSLATVQ